MPGAGPARPRCGGTAGGVASCTSSTNHRQRGGQGTRGPAGLALPWPHPRTRGQSEGCVMATKITRDVLEAYLNCKTKGHLRLAGERGTASDYEELTTATTRAAREDVLPKLVARFREG